MSQNDDRAQYQRQGDVIDSPAGKPHAFLFIGLIALALLGVLAAAKAYQFNQVNRTADALADFCKEPSDLRRMACVNIRPADAAPLPPQS